MVLGQLAIKGPWLHWLETITSLQIMISVWATYKLRSRHHLHIQLISERYCSLNVIVMMKNSPVGSGCSVVKWRGLRFESNSWVHVWIVIVYYGLDTYNSQPLIVYLLASIDVLGSTGPN